MDTAGVHTSVAEGRVIGSRAVVKGKMPISFTTTRPFAIFEPVLMHALQCIYVSIEINMHSGIRNAAH